MTRLAMAAHGDEYCGQTSSATYGDVVEAISLSGIQSGERILDAGCGNGCFAVRLALDFGYRVDGIDVSAPLVESARTIASEAGVEHLTRFVAGDFNDIALLPTPVSLVLAIGSLYWNPAMDALVKGWSSILRPGGAMVIMSNLLRHPLDSSEQSAVGSTSFIREDDLVATMRASGFSIERFDNTDRYVAWLERWCESMHRSVADLERDLGKEAADAIIRRFDTYLALAEARKVLRVVIVGRQRFTES